MKRTVWSRLAKMLGAISVGVTAALAVGQLREGEIAHRHHLEVARMANDTIVNSFAREVNRAADSVLNPHLSFTMYSGKSGNGPVPSSLSQDSAMGPWNKTSSSIRLRPNGLNKNAPPGSSGGARGQDETLAGA